jgi:predicted ribosome quality control (RQC) complex YloA/Tae2 family protein
VPGNSSTPFRPYAVEGFEVLVGRGAAENDTLTFRVAEARDFWLHVAGTPGSHVVVRNPDGLERLPKRVLERAAELAAWHSKSRARQGKIEVHVCRVSDVSKRRGAPAGEVTLRRYETVRIYARDLAAEESGSPPTGYTPGS